jgi:hypothetical protein
MCRRTTIFILLILCAFIVINNGWTGESSLHSESLGQRIRKSEQILSHLSQNTTPDELDNIKRNLIEITKDLTSQNESHRTIKLMSIQLWLKFFEGLYACVDPNFNEKDAPLMNIAPPSPKYPSGIAPEAIKEKEIKIKYENMLRDNKKRADKYFSQINLRQTTNECVFLFGQYCILLSDKGMNKTDIGDLIDIYISDPEKREDLKKAASSKVASCAKIMNGENGGEKAGTEAKGGDTELPAAAKKTKEAGEEKQQ